MLSHSKLGHFCLLWMLSALLAPAGSAAITYQLAPQDAIDDGWMFDGGFITTDGTLGEIDPRNFVDWSIGFRSPARENLLTPENGGASLLVESLVDINRPGPIGPSLALVATENHLMIPPVDGGARISILDLYFSTEPFASDGFPGVGVAFGRSSVGFDGILGPRSLGRMIDDAILGPPNPFGLEPGPGASAFGTPDSNYVFASIASVPEPNTCTLFCLILLVCFIKRRRIYAERKWCEPCESG